MSKQIIKKILFFLLISFDGLSQTELLKYIATINDLERSKGYYFLFTYSMKNRKQKLPGQEMIIDGAGHLVYYRKKKYESDFKIHPNGLISYFEKDKFTILNSQFKIVDSVGCTNSYETDPHDLIILSNGHYLLTGMKTRKEDLSKYPIFINKKTPGSKNGKIRYGIVQEFDSNKKLIFEWDSEPYFQIENIDPIYLNDTNMLDVTHFNSVEIDKDANIIISARSTNEVVKISKHDGKILWRFGGKLNDYKLINDSILFLGQHDARIIKNGHLTIFDNGYGNDHKMHNARALEYKLDEKRKTAKLVWFYEYDKPLISEGTGNAQRLSNGNTLVNFGKVLNESPNITFVEVDRKKNKIFELYFNDTIGSYRVFHYSNLPFELPQPSLVVNCDGGVCNISVNNDYSSYEWSTGEKTKGIAVHTSGIYYVYVPFGEGAFLSSVPLKITDEMLRRR